MTSRQKVKVESDGEEDERPSNREVEEEGPALRRALTPAEKEDAELAAMPLMPDSEISPAAFIFKQIEEERGDIDIYEER